MSEASQIRKLARKLDRLERAVMNFKQPNLGLSSVDGGAIQITDDDGNLRMIIGQQPDETFTSAVVSGPTPPVPTMALAAQTFNGIRVYWDGTFVGGAATPADFSRVTVHASTDPDEEDLDPLDPATYFGEITSPAGGEVFCSLPVGVEQYVFLVCWAQSGEFSSPSVPDFATPGAITATEIEDGSITTPKLAANAVTATKIAGDAIDGKTITGALMRTAAADARTEISDAGGGYSGLKDVRFYTDSSTEVEPGYIGGSYAGPESARDHETRVVAPMFDGQDPNALARLILLNTNDSAYFGGGAGDAVAFLVADRIDLSGEKVNLGLEAFFQSGRGVRGLDFGRINTTCDGSGEMTVAHDLGAAPLCVIAWPNAAMRPWIPSHKWALTDGSNLHFKLYDPDGNVTAGSGETADFCWIAIR